MKHLLFQRRTLIYLTIVVVTSNWTHFRNYGFPREFYDEAYYVADAQKYLAGVYFADVHPPLGKLLIAAGEGLFQVNDIDGQFLSVPVAKDFPPDFSMLGYRFFPALLGWATAPVLFVIFLIITEDPFAALCLSSLYVFDNALIVHLRGALLEAPLIFCASVAMLAFVLIATGRAAGRHVWWAATLLGLGIGGAMASTETGGILLLLVPSVALAVPARGRRFAAASVAALVAAGVYVAVWHAHFSRAIKVNPALEDGGYYGASPAARTLLNRGQSGNITALPVMLTDALRYTVRSHRLMPPRDRCNPREAGSPAWLWPIGGRAINYRAETADGSTFRYVYLIGNPVVWWTVLGAIVTAIVRLTIWRGRPRDALWVVSAVFTTMYIAYLTTIAALSRVVYLHSYLLALVIGFPVVAASCAAMPPKKRAWALGCWCALVIAGYAAYYPLTYARPITNEHFARLAVVPAWDLQCGNCPAPHRPGCAAPAPR